MPTLNLGQVRFVSRGEYDNAASYSNLDVVFHEGISYFCIKPVLVENEILPDAEDAGEFWQILVDRGSASSLEVTTSTGTRWRRR